MISSYRKSGNLVFLSGITGDPGDAKTQVKNVFEKIKKVLQQCGSSMENVLSVVVYLPNLKDRETALDPLWKEYFPTKPPARTTVEAGLGPGRLVEMAAIAEIPSGEAR